MKDILVGAAIPTGIFIFCAIVAGLKKRGKTVSLGITHGEWLSALINKWIDKIPAPEKPKKKLEATIEDTAIDYLDGFKIGLKLDNKEDKKALKKKFNKVNTEDEIRKIKRLTVL